MHSVLLFPLLLCGLGLEVKAICFPNPDDVCFRCFEPSFTEFNGRCYRFVDQEVDWIDGEKTCNQFHGNLASYHSQDEYDFIRSLISQGAGSDKPSWVGGSDAVKEGTWLWSDGSPFTFTNWASGEPNNAGGNESCMQINFRGMDYVNDAPCDLKLPFVCARNP